ncbi:MAG: ribokinase [Pseudomonadales bacterium]|nr:ribokinase [Pseudomonadales bacterium]
MPKLVNLGSLCIDHVYRVPAFTGPGETVSSLTHEVFPGGKGLNQSIAAARAGIDVVHVGCVGEDGGWLTDTLSAEGIDVSGLRVAEGASGHAMIQVNESGENAIVIFGGTNRTLARDDMETALARVERGDWLMLQNEINDLDLVLRLAGERGCQVAFNVAPVDGREAGYDLSCVGLLIVNEIEASALAGTDATGDDWSGVMAALGERAPKAAIVLTLGADGLVYRDETGLTTFPAYAVTAVDETAAGDAFIGFLMGSLIQGESMESALRMGSAAGALAVTQAGAASSLPAVADVRGLVQTGP